MPGFYTCDLWVHPLWTELLGDKKDGFVAVDCFNGDVDGGIREQGWDRKVT